MDVNLVGSIIGIVTAVVGLVTFFGHKAFGLIVHWVGRRIDGRMKHASEEAKDRDLLRKLVERAYLSGPDEKPGAR